jgi:hypothetical protein
MPKKDSVVPSVVFDSPLSVKTTGAEEILLVLSVANASRIVSVFFSAINFHGESFVATMSATFLALKNADKVSRSAFVNPA